MLCSSGRRVATLLPAKQIKIDTGRYFPTFSHMKATKQSISLPPKLNSWLENEMRQFSQTRSSIIQESLRPIEANAKELRKLAIDTGLSQSALVEAAITYLVRHFSAKAGRIILPMDMDEIISTLQKQRGQY